jgi:guanylate kinase
LDLDTQGAFQVKKTNPEAILIFIKPPSIDDLRKRLVARGTDSTQVIEGRIKRAEDEIKQSSSYGFVVINQDLEKAKEDLKKILSNPTLGKR